MSGDATERFQALGRLFSAALERAPGERAPFVREAAGDDAELASEVLELLEADGNSDADISLRSAVGRAAATLARADVQGMRLGSWRVLRSLGEGGMGTVYLAERADGAYETLAAVKLVRGGLPSHLLDGRLRAERRILANLTHPGIARLLDGGATPDGVPYLVMEYVEGLPVTEWCDRQATAPEDRVRLVLRICDAVEHAHRQLVVHRDIKPANILVTPDGDPKLLDFGVARLVDRLDESGPGGTADGVTRSWRMLTPAYASPEQLRGEDSGVSADVYALGVLLYRLLAGRLPLEVQGLPVTESTRRVQDEVPPVLSAVARLPTRRQFLSDMDAILSRALRKEPENRYPTVAALSDDLRRHLEGRPISTRRDDWRYRVRKFVGRNAGAVTSGALVTLLLVAFTVSSLVQARKVAAERDRAEQERETAQRVTAFLTDLFAGADPNENAGALTARELVDRGAASVLAGTGDDPPVQAALATTLGSVYRSLGEYGDAAPLLDSAVAVARRAGLPPGRLAKVLATRGELAYDEGEYEGALALYREGLEAALRTGDPALVADLTEGVAGVELEMGELEAAETRFREVLAVRRELAQGADPALASTLLNLADALRDRGRYDEAVSLGQESLAVTRQAHGPNSLQLASALNHLASTLTTSGRSGEALPYLREGLEIRERVFPDGHPETAASLGNLANVLGGLERYPEAEAARRRSLAMFRAFFPDEHLYVAATTHSLGSVLSAQQKYDEALEVLTEALRLHRAALGSEHPNNGYPLTELGRVHLALEDPARAEPFLREAYTLRRDGLGADHWFVGATALDLGRAVDLQGRREEARVYLEESLELLQHQFGDEDGRTTRARTTLVEHLRSRGLEAEAEAVAATGPVDGGQEGGAGPA